MNGVILLGKGGYSDAPQIQMARMVEAVRAHYDLVLGAFIDAGTPSLLEALATCVAQQVNQIIIAPVYVPSDRNLDAWLSQIARRWLLDHPQVALFSALPLGDHLGAALLAMLENPQPLAPRATRPHNPEWSVILPHHYHVLLCRGVRCNTRGNAGAVQTALKDALARHGLAESDVLVAQTGCMYPCNLGALMVVYPEGVWYCGLTPHAVEEIVTAHFLGGEIATRYARYPAPHAQQRPTENEDAP